MTLTIDIHETIPYIGELGTLCNILIPSHADIGKHFKNGMIRAIHLWLGLTNEFKIGFADQICHSL